MQSDIADIEYDLWRMLCELLTETKRVTKADLKSPVAECKTDGQKLLRALRAYAEDPKNDIARATINRACRNDADLIICIRKWVNVRGKL